MYNYCEKLTISFYLLFYVYFSISNNFINFVDFIIDFLLNFCPDINFLFGALRVWIGSVNSPPILHAFNIRVSLLDILHHGIFSVVF